MENKEKSKYLPILTFALIIATGALSFGTVRDMIGAAGGKVVVNVKPPANKPPAIKPPQNQNSADNNFNPISFDMNLGDSIVAAMQEKCVLKSKIEPRPDDRGSNDYHKTTGCVRKVEITNAESEFPSCIVRFTQFDGRNLSLTPERKFLCPLFIEAFHANSVVTIKGRILWDINKTWTEAANGDVWYTQDSVIVPDKIELSR